MSETSSNTTAVAGTRSARCPRCGYDQRGVVDAWKESCPIDGVCSECGLEWRWAEVFNPRLHRPRWCVEYGRVIAFPWRCVKTLCVSFWPWAFWSRLQMHHEAKWGRIAAYLAVLVCLAYPLFLVQIGVQAYQTWREINAQFMMSSKNWQQMSPAQIQRYRAKGYVPENFIVSKPMPSWKAVGHALLLPWSEEFSGEYVFADGTTRPYRAKPRDFSAASWNGLRNSLWSPNRSLLSTLSFPLCMLVLMPLLFALLPQSRRVAKVRPAHLVRITSYSLALWIIAALVLLDRIPARLAWDAWAAREHWPVFAIVSFVVIPVATLIWWGSAISRHLRMRRPWAIAVSLALIAYLLPMLCGYFWLIVDMRPQWFMSG